MTGFTEIIRLRVANEVGVVRKDHGGRVRVCLVYPNTYFVGMSSLGFQSIYYLLNQNPEAVCERAFVPDKDELAELERTRAEFISYESQTPLGQFDVIALSVSYELDYIGVGRVLRLAKVPAMSRDRGKHHPIVIAGGAAVSINPDPLADLMDAVVIGEGEKVVGDIVRAIRSAAGKEEALEKMGDVEGIWVPREEKESGDPTGGKGQRRRYVRDLERWPTHSRLLTSETEFGGLFLVEVSRGCGRGCKFCVTPACYWPLRWRSVEGVLRSARGGMAHRDAIGLVGAAVSDHPEIDEIATRVVGMGARLSVSSLRADSVSDDLIHALARSGARSITIGVEAGSERLRDRIGKGITDEHIFDALRRASGAGIKEAKLYFMVGLPGETEEDVEAIPKIVRRCMREGNLRRITVAAGAFVPKPETPYAGGKMLPVRELSRRLRVIRDSLRREKRVRLALESANWSMIEGILSQGDRRLGEVIVNAEARGGNLAAWRGAMRDGEVAIEDNSRGAQRGD